ncbi:MAG: hypothetical protein NC489_28735 [Ruminococcus flavefaciens]|nr:hypothetical protein [Ruminococcus flavefaciens]
MAKETNKQVAGHTEAAGTVESKYSKEQILGSAKFAGRRDILGALLADGEEYTIAEVGRVMDGWFKKGVK